MCQPAAIQPPVRPHTRPLRRSLVYSLRGQCSQQSQCDLARRVAAPEDECIPTRAPPRNKQTPSPTMNDGLANGEASSSSSSQSPQHASHALPRDEDDARRPDTADSDLLGDDPLTQDLAEPISFKRKQKRPGIGLGLLTSLTGSLRDQRGGNNGPNASSGRLQYEEPEEAPYPETYHSSPRRRGGGNNTTSGSTPKDGAPLDWHVEGPGQRVGYENLTAIDWIFEYTKERARLRVLNSSAVGLVGYAQRLLDASQEWIILVLTGLLVGALAAGIDVVSDWLGDLKAGYCSTTDGGAFYLNKNFCCLGYDEGAQCMGWRPWATALHISSAAGKWIIEYFFFISLSVCSTPNSRPSKKTLLTTNRCFLLFAPAFW